MVLAPSFCQVCSLVTVLDSQNLHCWFNLAVDQKASLIRVIIECGNMCKQATSYCIGKVGNDVIAFYVTTHAAPQGGEFAHVEHLTLVIDCAEGRFWSLLTLT